MSWKLLIIVDQVHIFVHKSLFFVFAKIPIQCKTNLISLALSHHLFPLKAVPGHLLSVFLPSLAVWSPLLLSFCLSHFTHWLFCLIRYVFSSLHPCRHPAVCHLGGCVKSSIKHSSQKKKNTQNNCYISKCSSKLGLSLWDSMGSPWKGFVEFTLPASTPTAYVSADLSSTSPVGLSLSPYGRSVSCTFVALFPCPHPITHPFTHLALHLFFVNGLAFFILFWVPENSLYSVFCRVREIFTRSCPEEIWQFPSKGKQKKHPLNFYVIFVWLLIC